MTWRAPARLRRSCRPAGGSQSFRADRRAPSEVTPCTEQKLSLCQHSLTAEKPTLCEARSTVWGGRSCSLTARGSGAEGPRPVSLPHPLREVGHVPHRTPEWATSRRAWPTKRSTLPRRSAAHGLEANRVAVPTRGTLPESVSTHCGERKLTCDRGADGGQQACPWRWAVSGHTHPASSRHHTPVPVVPYVEDAHSPLLRAQRT